MIYGCELSRQKWKTNKNRKSVFWAGGNIVMIPELQNVGEWKNRAVMNVKKSVGFVSSLLDIIKWYNQDIRNILLWLIFLICCEWIHSSMSPFCVSQSYRFALIFVLFIDSCFFSHEHETSVARIDLPDFWSDNVLWLYTINGSFLIDSPHLLSHVSQYHYLSINPANASHFNMIVAMVLMNFVLILLFRWSSLWLPFS